MTLTIEESYQVAADKAAGKGKYKGVHVRIPPQGRCFYGSTCAERWTVGGKSKGRYRQTEKEVFHHGITRDGDCYHIILSYAGSAQEFTGQALQLAVDEPHHHMQIISRSAGGLQAGYHVGAKLPLRVKGTGHGQPDAPSHIHKRSGDGSGADIEGYGKALPRIRRFQPNAPGRPQ